MNNSENEVNNENEINNDVRAASHRRPPHKKRKIFKHIFLGLLAFLAIAGLSAYFVFIKPEYERLKSVAYDKLASVNVQEMTKLPDTKVYDKDGKQLGMINAGHFVYAKISDISLNLQNAYIAQEDRNFKIHHGVDYKATLRALISLVKNKGKITQGGSTITQQVVKNTYLTSERTFTRKFVEMMLATELEKMYTKAEIMEFYCNTNFYGNNCYGVEAASQYYFNKSAKDLNETEAATLAGISNAPSKYEPVHHADACLTKRNQVLHSMLECGYITQDQYNTFTATDISVVQNKQEETDEDYLTSYALQCAALTLMDLNHFQFEYIWDNKDAETAYQEKYSEAYDYYTNEIRGGGYSIYTSLDPKIQKEVQDQLDSGLSGFSEKQENGKYALQGAAAVVDNKTGYVVATVGGRGADDKYNRAYLSVRQPGSSIKPLLDYAPALDSGEYSPATMIDDHEMEDGPANSGGTYHGLVTLREALNRSLNTVAWQILDDMGTKYGIDYLAKLHFQGLDWVDTTTKAVSIGGFTNGVRVVDMAKGYSALADMGQYSGNTCITRIVHEAKGELTKGYQPAGEQVYREDTAWMMTDILKGTITQQYGTGYGLALKNAMPCAGKTGTTNESKDTWFCGYTKYYTMAVWVGYDTPQAMPGVYGATYAGKIWKAAMDVLHEGLAPEDWPQPATVEKRLDETTGVEDYASTTDSVRAEASLQEKAEKKNEEEVKDLLENYESMEVGTVEDVYTERDLYEKAKPIADSLTDSAVRSDVLERLLERKKYFDNVEDGMKDTIDRYEAVKAKESREQQSIDASKAEIERQETEKKVNKDSFLSALKSLEDLTYQDSNTESLIEDAIDKLQYCNDYEEAYSYAADLEDTINKVRALPYEAEYAQQLYESEAASSAAAKAEEERIKALQDSLRETTQAAPSVPTAPGATANPLPSPDGPAG